MHIIPIVTCPGQSRLRIGLSIENSRLSLIFGQKAGFDKTQTVLVFTFTDNDIVMSATSTFSISDSLLIGYIDKMSTDELKLTFVHLYEKWIKTWDTETKNFDEICKELITFLTLKLRNKFDDVKTLSSSRYGLTLKTRNQPIVL